MSIPVYPFEQNRAAFTFNTLLTNPEVIAALSKVHAECNRVASMSLFHLTFTKVLRLEEFELAQSQTHAQVLYTAVSTGFTCCSCCLVINTHTMSKFLYNNKVYPKPLCWCLIDYYMQAKHEAKHKACSLNNAKSFPVYTPFYINGKTQIRFANCRHIRIVVSSLGHLKWHQTSYLYNHQGLPYPFIGSPKVVSDFYCCSKSVIFL